MKTTINIFLLAVLFGLVIAPSAQCDSEDEFTPALVQELSKDGFQVSQGYTALYTQENCFENTYPAFKNCFQANPAAPYIVPVMKSWPDEYIDPATENAFVDTDPGYSVTYRLDPREAILIYGKMPPPGRYMGLQTWEFSYHGKWKTKDYMQWANTPNLTFPIQYLFNLIPPDDPKSKRILSLSFLGDAINSVTMENQMEESPFEKFLFFIISPSFSTDKAVRDALKNLEIDDRFIFTQQIPKSDDLGPIGPLGMGKNAIDFFTAFRYAVPDPEYLEAAKSWRENPPLKVLRVRAPGSLGPVKRFGKMSLGERTANFDENNLAGDLQDLVEAVCSNVTANTSLNSPDCGTPPPASSIMADLVKDNGWTGPYCREIGMNCLGDQTEAAYYFSTPRPTDTGQVFAIVGTLGTETNNAVYVGLSANDASIMAGVPNGTLLDTQLKGSADIYESDVDNTNMFFVRYFAKDCSELQNVPGGPENCTVIGGMSTTGDPDLQDMVIFSLRNYIAPGTTLGPDLYKVLAPRIIMFQ